MIAPLPPGGDAIFVESHHPEFRNLYGIHSPFDQTVQYPVVLVQNPNDRSPYRLMLEPEPVVAPDPAIIAAVLLVAPAVNNLTSAFQADLAPF